MTGFGLEVEFRPIEVWPGALRGDHDRKMSPFKAKWRDTRGILDRELGFLNAHRAVLQLALGPRSFTRDGLLRSDHREPDHPGVILSFDSMHGPLTYSTDVYDNGWGVGSNEGARGWRGNVRAIALALEGLRKFDRYGITTKGEQYQGWKALGSGTALGMAEELTPDAAARVFYDLANDAGWWGPLDTTWNPGTVLDEAIAGDPSEALKRGYRAAAKLHHPDANGGNEGPFLALEAAWRVLQEAMS